MAIQAKPYKTRLAIYFLKPGALQGSSTEQAFFVKAGLAETMTNIDIHEGRMIVEIGLAVLRPAEFTILRLMHKMPEEP